MAQHVKDLALSQLWHRLQLWDIFDPRPGMWSGLAILPCPSQSLVRKLRPLGLLKCQDPPPASVMGLEHMSSGGGWGYEQIGVVLQKREGRETSNSSD